MIFNAIHHDTQYDLSWYDAGSVRCRASPAIYISVMRVKVAKLVKCHLTSFVKVTILVKCGGGEGVAPAAAWRPAARPAAGCRSRATVGPGPRHAHKHTHTVRTHARTHARTLTHTRPHTHTHTASSQPNPSTEPHPTKPLHRPPHPSPPPPQISPHLHPARERPTQ